MGYKEIIKIKDLNRGDIVRHKSRNGTSYVVNAVYGDRATAVTTADITSPDEWEVMRSDSDAMDIENKKHAEFNRLFPRIGLDVKPEYRHQRVVITD